MGHTDRRNQATQLPAVVELRLSRNDLATLQSLAFVRGDFAADDFWSLVHL
jgi:hypothetical protein